MHAYWIVVANAGRACIYRKTQGLAGLDIVHQLENPAGRLHICDLVEDQRGRIEKHGCGVISAMDQAHDPHEQCVKDFAHNLCHLLDVAANRREFDELVLLAPAHFLGLLRGGQRAHAKKLPQLCLATDLTHLTLADLEDRLTRLLHFRPVESATVCQAV
jgi:protein required for attachment to host cells